MSKSHPRIIGRIKEDGMILPLTHKKSLSVAYLFIVAIAIAAMMTSAGTLSAAVKQKSFGSAEEAVKALVTAARNNDNKEILAIFGPGSKDLIFSGDKVADKERREKFLSAYDEQNKLVPQGNEMILEIGKNEFPFAIPIVKKGEAWIFDTKKGREEVLNRRIGEDELDAIQTCLAIVDAQREFAMMNRYGEYAEKFSSDPGKKNGLYWPTKEGEKPSPLGQLFAKAKSEGYSKRGTSGKAEPYHGYYYRMLEAQGRNADGGAYSYIINKKMIGGFAVVAWPAKYGNSGIMTFIVNHDGIVYQKNLGPKTTQIAEKMAVFNPDTSWKKAQ
jgi:hypothetical protein